MKKKPKAVKARRPVPRRRTDEAKCCVAVRFAGRAAMDLQNTYQDIVMVSVAAPRKGSVALTGSGMARVLSAAGTPWGWVNISIGPISGGANNGNETAVEMPGVPGGNVVTSHPFSLTTVFPVAAGAHRFYMVGIQDPNANQWSVNFAKLTAVYVQS